MGKRLVIAVGTRFGRLTFLADASSPSGLRMARFRCDCGREAIKRLHEVRSGHTSSCGCYHTERIRSPKTHGATTGRAGTPEYRAWKAMKGRCYYRKNIGYANYGGRGIRVCAAWRHDFQAFLDHVGPKPSPSHSLDRIDVNGDYKPGNVRWATRREQRENTREALTPRPPDCAQPSAEGCVRHRRRGERACAACSRARRERRERSRRRQQTSQAVPVPVEAAVSQELPW